MSEIYAKKNQDGAFVLLGEDGERFTKNAKIGQDVIFEAKIPRNARFHRKIFALLKMAFDNWEPGEIAYKGRQARKSFDRFRKDLVIKAGFWEPVINVNGEVRAEPDSLSYKHCSQEKAEKIYSALLDVVAEQFFSGEFSKEKLDQLTEKWLSFN